MSGKKYKINYIMLNVISKISSVIYSGVIITYPEKFVSEVA